MGTLRSPSYKSKVVSINQSQPVAFIHAMLDDFPLSANEFRVYCHLVRRCSGADEAWPSHQGIADHCQISLPTVKRVLRRLEALRMISVRSGQRDGRSNLYSLLDPTQWIKPDQPVEKVQRLDLQPVENSVDEAGGSSPVTEGVAHQLPTGVAHQLPTKYIQEKLIQEVIDPPYPPRDVASATGEGDVFQKRRERREAADRIFDHWLKVFEKTKATKKTSVRVKAIEKALGTYSEPEITEAITGLASDPFWKAHDDLSVLLRFDLPGRQNNIEKGFELLRNPALRGVTIPKAESQVEICERHRIADLDRFMRYASKYDELARQNGSANWLPPAEKWMASNLEKSTYG